MNELITAEQAEALRVVGTVLPGVPEAFRRAALIMQSIHNFQDVEQYLLRGQGLSPATYRTYMSAIRKLYKYTDSLNPLQIRAGHLEAFYDFSLTQVETNSAYNRMKALKCFFLGIETQLPGFVSPFKSMEERLIKKMGKTKKVTKQRALTAGDAKRLLRYLEGDEKSLLGLSNYATTFFLLYSGLRAAELCGLRWKDIEYDEDQGVCFCGGVGKGGKPFHQEIGHPDCIKACLRAFTAQFKREPKQDERIFWTVPTRPGEQFRPLNPHSLWYRLTKIGEQIRAAGIITKDYTWSPHLMRRSAGTLLDKKGVSLVAIQNFLRHEDVSTTAKHYIDNQELVGARLAEMLN